jgi:hypothetical protein
MIQFKTFVICDYVDLRAVSVSPEEFCTGTRVLSIKQETSQLVTISYRDLNLSRLSLMRSIQDERHARLCFERNQWSLECFQCNHRSRGASEVVVQKASVRLEQINPYHSLDRFLKSMMNALIRYEAKIEY